MIWLWVVGFLLVICAPPALAAFKPVGLFQDNMVLQQGMPIPVWGMAPPGTRITVVFAGEAATGVADSQERWKVVLKPMPHSIEPRQLTISDGVETLVIKNVLVGEVWVCSGQSNMELRLKDANNAQAEMQASGSAGWEGLVPRSGPRRCRPA